jgi:replicative DNA helicase
MTVVPAQSLEAEESVLGAMLMSANAIDRVAAIIRDGAAFYRPSHGKLYELMVRMHYDGRPVDPITVDAAIKDEGEPDVGSYGDLAMLVATTAATANVEHHARIVVDAWKRRKLKNLALGLVQLADEGTNGDDALDAFDQALVNARSEFDRGVDTVRTAFDLANQYDREMKDPPDVDAGVPVPFPFLPPMQGGRLYVLGGYTGDGKTVGAVQFCRTAAEAGVRTGLVTLEMSAMQLVERIIASHGVPYRQVIRRTFIGQHNVAAAEQAISQLTLWKLDLIDDPTADAAAIARYQRAGRYEFLIVDHLHRMAWTERRELEQEVVAITNIAKRFEIPVLLLVQLSRGQGSDPFPMPSLRSLRETSVIEQEASRVDFIWRRRDDKHLPTEEAEYIIAKNRYGPMGSHDLRFNAQEVRFEP